MERNDDEPTLISNSVPSILIKYTTSFTLIQRSHIAVRWQLSQFWVDALAKLRWSLYHIYFIPTLTSLPSATKILPLCSTMKSMSQAGRSSSSNVLTILRGILLPNLVDSYRSKISKIRASALEVAGTWRITPFIYMSPFTRSIYISPRTEFLFIDSFPKFRNPKLEDSVNAKFS